MEEEEFFLFVVWQPQSITTPDGNKIDLSPNFKRASVQKNLVDPREKYKRINVNFDPAEKQVVYTLVFFFDGIYNENGCPCINCPFVHSVFDVEQDAINTKNNILENGKLNIIDKKYSKIKLTHCNIYPILISKG
jgi:hypothetical protein